MDYINLLLISSFIIVFYFYILRPQIENKKNEKLFWEKLQKGDTIKTIYGIYGQYVTHDNSKMTISIYKNITMEIDINTVDILATIKLKENKNQ